MRIRTVKPEFFTHESLYDAESAENLPLRLAFIGLWCASDREGRFKWEPRRLGVQILPYDQIDFSRVLDALTTRGFIVRYATDTGEFGCIPSFSRHQVINNRERDSELPEPSQYKVPNACITRAPRVDHAGKVEGKGMEGKGMDLERENTRGKQPTRRPTLAQALTAATDIGITPTKAEEWWNCREASEWLKGMAGGGTSPVGSNWRADLTTYARRGISGAGNSTPRTNHRAEKREKEFEETTKLKMI